MIILYQIYRTIIRNFKPHHENRYRRSVNGTAQYEQIEICETAFPEVSTTE